jgi:hypothetical protein
MYNEVTWTAEVSLNSEVFQNMTFEVFSSVKIHIRAFLAYSIVKSGKWLPTFRRSMVTTSTTNTEGVCSSVTLRSIPIRLRDIISQKNIVWRFFKLLLSFYRLWHHHNTAVQPVYWAFSPQHSSTASLLSLLATAQQYSQLTEPSRHSTAVQRSVSCLFFLHVSTRVIF